MICTRSGRSPRTTKGFDPQSERFARDSALEGDGFEPSVPHKKTTLFGCPRSVPQFAFRRLFPARTDGSNPSPSSGASCANLTFGRSSRRQFGSDSSADCNRSVSSRYCLSAGSWFSMGKPKSESWWPSSAGSIGVRAALWCSRARSSPYEGFSPIAGTRRSPRSSRCRRKRSRRVTILSAQRRSRARSPRRSGR